jgi:SAM-dependent methyltransferase
MDSTFKPEYFERHDNTPDEVFYQPPRLVKHIDEPACAALARYYDTILPADGAVLDLMSSWVSHLPQDNDYDRVIALGMNAVELAANTQATAGLVHNLNTQPVLPFADQVFDGCVLTVSIQYLVQPGAVFREVGRVLKPGAPLAIAYSNRMFPTKAVAVWQAVNDEKRAQLINLYFEQAGMFEARKFEDISPHPGQTDPLFVVTGVRVS